ncbi:MAG: DNA recombination protein RmuC [bacterium]
MENLILILLLVIAGVVLYATFKPTKVAEQTDSKNLVNEILVGLLEKLNLNQQQQNEVLNQNSAKTETKLLELQNKLSQSFENQTQTQKLEFEKIKTENLSELNKIQTSLQEKLNLAVQSLLEVNNKNFEALGKNNQQRLDQINLDVQKRLDENFAQNLKSFQEVTKNLGQMEQKAQAMIESTKSIDKLNNIFSRTSSKAFGGFAENYLESLLSENLASGTWSKQVKVPESTEIIDFVIHVDDKKIGIDAKFPLTKYQDFIEADLSDKESKRKEFLRAVMEMAKSISEKYYKNGFIDALLMYLPSESMYNEVLDTEKNQQVGEFLQKHRISLTSPNTIFPQILLIKTYQFKLQVSQNAENIVKGLQQIKKNIGSFKEEYRKLGDKIQQAQQNYDQANRNLIGVEKNIMLLETSEGVTEDLEKQDMVV